MAQPSSSKANIGFPSVLDLFSKQLAKRKRIASDLSNEPSQQSQDSNTEDNSSLTNAWDKENQNPQLNKKDNDNHLEKKIKTENDTADLQVQIKRPVVNPGKCEYCRQKLNDDIKLYQGHPNGAVEEYVALTDPKLCLFAGDESFIHESDEHPQNKLTYFRYNVLSLFLSCICLLHRFFLLRRLAFTIRTATCARSTPDS